MKITELEWIVENKNKLTPEEAAALEENEVFEQHKKGELHYPLTKMVRVMELITNIYNAHQEDL